MTKNLQFSSLLLLFVCLQACAEDVVTKPTIESSVSFIESSDELLIASVELSADVAIENIQIRRDAHLKDWVLEFRSIAKLKVSSQPTGQEEWSFQIDDAAFSQLIGALIDTLSIEHSHITIGRIQFDLYLVASTWDSVLASLKQEAQGLAGNVEQMSEPISKAIIRSISESSQVEVTCRLMEAVETFCRDKPVSMNPVVFDPEIVGMPWDSVIERSDGGLRKGAWFTIRME